MGADATVTAALGGGLTGIEPILDLLPTPLLLIEPGTARVLYANRAANRLAGGAFPLDRPAEAYADAYPCVDEAGRPIAVDGHPGVRAARGERFTGLELDWRTPGAGTRSLMVSGDRIDVPGHGPVAVVTFEDVTDAVQTRRRAALLADAGTRLAESLDHEATLAAVGDILVPRHADWCFVELLEEDGSISRALMRHEDAGRCAFASDYDRRFPLDPAAPTGSANVIRTGEPELREALPDGWMETIARDAEQLELLRRVGFTSSLIVPLRVGGRVIGDLALAMADSGRRFTADDVGSTQDLADRIALGLENARLFSELRAILGGVADAVTVQARGGRVVYANAAAALLLGYPSPEALLEQPPERLFSPFEAFDEDGEPVGVERLPGRQVLAGAEPVPITIRFRRTDTAQEGWAHLKSTPVHGPDGRVRLAVNVIEDVTEIKRAEIGQRFLADASAALAGSLDYQRTLAAVAELAVPRVADWCAVDLVGHDGIERVAVAHVDPARVQLAREIQRRYPPDARRREGVLEILDTGRPALHAEIPDDLLAGAARDPEHLELLRSVGMRSLMIVPMALRDRVLGAITFVTAESGRRYDDHDLALARDLGVRAAMAIENARLYETRSAIAHTLQASLLPPHLPDIPGIDVAATYQAAGEGHEVGGDFYDVFSTAPDQWFVVIGDVCGKGAEAAAVTALARYTLRAAAVRRRSPSGLLRTVNEAMLRQEDVAGRFCTIACAQLDLSRRAARVTVACGGHPLPLVRRAGGGVRELGTPGTLLGLVPDPELHDVATDLLQGDTLLLYTDGLTEAGAPAHVWSPRELCERFAAAPDGGAVGMVADLVGAALGDRPAPRDDIAVLALRAR